MRQHLDIEARFVRVAGMRTTLIIVGTLGSRATAFVVQRNVLPPRAGDAVNGLVTLTVASCEFLTEAVNEYRAHKS